VNCLYCRNRIGLLRRLIDTEYCSDAHRESMRNVSSRALRDVDSSPSDYDIFRSRFVHQRQSGTELLLLAGIAACLFLMLTYDGARTGAIPNQVSIAGTVAGLEEQWRTVRGKYDWDFQSGMGSWTNPKEPLSSRTNWTSSNGAVRPAELRIWDESKKLTDYRLEFAGRISAKGMSWAYRAVDSRNYYAGKLLLSGSPSASRAEMIRYAVVSGRESARARILVPLAVRAERTYQIRTDVKGTSFTTFVNGKLVDHWSDDRIARGGVGFFADRGEIAGIYHVDLAAENSLIGKLLAHVGFFAPVTPKRR
jgi:hypothetical protein